MIKVTPPMTSQEAPVVLTLIKVGMQVTTINREMVNIFNPTDRYLPMLFFVAPSGYDLGWASSLRHLLLGV